MGFKRIYHCHFEDFKPYAELPSVENCCTYLQQDDTLILLRRLAKLEPKNLHSDNEWGIIDFMYVCPNAGNLIPLVKEMRWIPKRHFRHSVNFLAGLFLGQYGENNYRGHVIALVRDHALKMHPADVLIRILRNTEDRQKP